jgi:hypothetical protein
VNCPAALNTVIATMPISPGLVSTCAQAARDKAGGRTPSGRLRHTPQRGQQRHRADGTERPSASPTGLGHPGCRAACPAPRPGDQPSKHEGDGAAALRRRHITPRRRRPAA